MSSGAIDPHVFSRKNCRCIEGHCKVCGLTKHLCELTYKPREPEVNSNAIFEHYFLPNYDTGRCRICALGPIDCEKQYKPDSVNPNSMPCNRFVGKREWGIYAEPWRPCQTCHWPKAQHGLPACPAALNVKGQHYNCDLNTPHDGWGHSNSELQAVWCDDRDKLTPQRVDVHIENGTGTTTYADGSQSTFCPACGGTCTKECRI